MKSMPPIASGVPPAATRALLACALALASACTVGPDYVRPSAPEPAEYKNAGDWKVAQPRDDVLRGPWWDVFGDPVLSSLEEQVDVSNQSLRAAEARFRQAQTLVAQARAGAYPTATVGVSLGRSRQSENLFGNLGGSGRTVSDFSTPVGISWEPDLWGRVRRLVESNEAGAQASAADLAAARLSLHANVAVNYFQIRTVDAQKEVLRETIAAYEKSLQLTRNRHDAGIASGADVAQAETQLETTRAQEIDLQATRAALEDAIAVLIGVPASDFSIAEAPLAGTPPAIPPGVPSEILERRPDVAAAERRIAAANAEIGVALAAYYPSVVLSASGGFESSDFGKWFTWPSRFWAVGLTMSETVYDAGLRAAQTEQARAAYDETVADYRQSVLGAFQQVEDQLAALRVLADESRVQAAAVDAAQRSVTLTRNRYEQGTASYIDVVTTQAAELANERTEVDLLGRRMAATVQLVAAVGGGWRDTDLPSGDEIADTAPPRTGG